MTAPTEQINRATEIKVSPEEAAPVEPNAATASVRLSTVGITTALALPSFGPEYETLNCIVQDSFGSLYRVRNVQMDKEFAVRHIGAEQFADEQAKKAFLRFCRRSLTVTHPALVPIYSFNESDDGIWMLTELRQELSLEQMIDDGQFKGTGKVLGVFEQLLDCLEALNQVGIRFGATCPASIIVAQSAQGTRLILRDWWASALVSAQSSATESDILCYASPEQLQDSAKIDVRSDIYSFGAILYEALTGRVPYADSNPLKLAVKILSGEVAPVEGPLADSSAAKIALVCLQKDPSKRFQCLDDLRADFKAAVRGSALPSDKMVKNLSWVKQHPARLFLLLTMAMMFMLNMAISRDDGGSYPSLDDPLQYAERAEERGDLVGAENILQAAVLSTPGDAEQWYTLGRIQLKNKQYSAAEKSLQEAIKLDPLSSTAHGVLGQLYGDLGQLPEAISQYEKAIQVDPSDTFAYCGLVGAYWRAERPVDMLATAEALMQVAPNDAASHYYLGFAYDKTQDYARAAREYKIVSTLDPKNDDVWSDLSRVYSHLKEPSKAIEAAWQAVSRDRGDSGSWALLAHAYLRAGNYVDSEKFYRKALSIDPLDGKALTGLSETLRKAGKKGEAKEIIKRLID